MAWLIEPDSAFRLTTAGWFKGAAGRCSVTAQGNGADSAPTYCSVPWLPAQGLWRGTVPGLLLTVPYTAVQFVALQQCKQYAAAMGLTGKRSGGGDVVVAMWVLHRFSLKV